METNKKTLEQLQNEYCDLMNGATFGDIAQFAKEHRDQLPQIREKWQAMKDAEQEQRKQEQRAKKRAQAVEFCKMRKDANKIAQGVAEIVKQYAGKRYGEKTAQAIQTKIADYMRGNFADYGAYLTNGAYSRGLSLYRGYGRDLSIYFDFLTVDNKIKEPENLRPFDEYDGGKIFDQLQDKTKQAAEKIKDLLPLIQEINHLRSLAGFNIYTPTADLERLKDEY